MFKDQKVHFSLPILKDKKTTNKPTKNPQAIKGACFANKTSLQVQNPQRANDGLLAGYIFT